MSTPRRAAAKAAAALRSGSSPTRQGGEALPGGRKDKKKVDWNDVEAKAKREAMWLLEWRKQQTAHATSLPTQHLPPKKRRRKSCSNDGTPTSEDSTNAAAYETAGTAPDAPDLREDSQPQPQQQQQQPEGKPAVGAEAAAEVDAISSYKSSNVSVTTPPAGQRQDGSPGPARILQGTAVLSTTPKNEPPAVAPSAATSSEPATTTATATATAAQGSEAAEASPTSPESLATTPPATTPVLALATTYPATAAGTPARAVAGAGEVLPPAAASDSPRRKDASGEAEGRAERKPMAATSKPCSTATTPDLVCPTPPTPAEVASVFQSLASHPRLNGGGVWGRTERLVLSAIDPTNPAAVKKKQPPPPPQQQQQFEKAAGKSAMNGSAGITVSSTSTSLAVEIARPADQKGICLLAEVAIGRALEEEARQQQTRQSGPPHREGERGLLSFLPRRVGGGASAGGLQLALGVAPKATAPTRKSAVAGGKNPSAVGSDARVEGSPTGGVGDRGSSLRWSLPWRPRELRFIVGTKDTPDVGAQGVSSHNRRGAYFQGQQEPERSGERATAAWWQGLPRMPGFSMATAEGETQARDVGGDVHGEGEGDVHGEGEGDVHGEGEGSGSPASWSSIDGARTTRDISSASSAAVEGALARGPGFSFIPAAAAAAAGASPAPLAQRTEWDKGPYSLRWLPADGLAALQAAGAACGMDRATLDAAAAAEQEEAERSRVAAMVDRAAYEAAAMETGPVMWGYDGYYDGGAAAAIQPRVVRPRAKRRPRRKRETHVLVSESDDEGVSTTTSVWAGLEAAAKAEAEAIISYKKSGMAEAEDDGNQHWVRRSVRAAGASALDHAHVVKLLEQIRADDPEVEVLKLHHYLGPDVNTAVIDAVLEALMVNGNCQALYIQNFNEGFRDEQVAALAKVLRRGNIWCLNAGENYKVKLATWWEFVEEIESTNVTHAYLSEHVITADLKKAMRKAIRDNRTKHDRHKAASNFEVIRRCTNMWWNPINSKYLQAELRLLESSFPGMAPVEGVPSPHAKRVPCSLHWKEEQDRKRLRMDALPPPLARPDSPDLTDCAPRGPIVFRREDDDEGGIGERERERERVMACAGDPNLEGVVRGSGL